MEIINEAMTRLCDEEFKPTLRQAVNLIAVSRHGLRFRDIKAILGDDFQELDFSRLKKYLSAFFIQRDTDGRIDFAHIISREGVRADLSKEDFKLLESKLADYLATLPIGDTVRAAEGFYFAQKARNFKFAADLLDETDLTRNPSLIQDIYLETLADDGNFLSELLKTHLNKETLDEKTLVKLAHFFNGVFNTMFNGGARESNVAIRLIDEFSANSFKNIEFEMMKIRMQTRLGKFKDAERTLLDIEKQLKNIPDDTLKNDTEFCRMMSDFYMTLSVNQMFNGNEKAALRYNEEAAKWTQAVPEKNYLDNASMNLFQTIGANLKQNAGAISEEDLLKVYENSYENALRAYEQNPTKLMNLDLVISNAGMIAIMNLNLNNLEKAVSYGKQANEFANILLTVDSDNLNSIMTAGMIKLFWSMIKLQTETLQNPAEIFYNISSALSLFIKYHKMNPTPYIQDRINDTVALFQKVYDIYQSILFQILMDED